MSHCASTPLTALPYSNSLLFQFATVSPLPTLPRLRSSPRTMPIAIPATQPGPDLSALPHTNSKAPFLEDLRTKGYAVIPSIIPQDRVERYIDDAHSWLEEFGMGYKRDDKATWRWVAAAAAASLFIGRCFSFLSTNILSSMPLSLFSYGGGGLQDEFQAASRARPLEMITTALRTLRGPLRYPSFALSSPSLPIPSSHYHPLPGLPGPCIAPGRALILLP